MLYFQSCGGAKKKKKKKIEPERNPFPLERI